MTQHPKVGDTVIIEGVVTSVDGSGYFCFNTDTHNLKPTHHVLNPLRIKTIIPKPWAPAVGDKVFIDTPYGGTYVYEIKVIDGDQGCLKKLRRTDGKPLFDSNLDLNLSVCRLKDLALCVDKAAE